MGRGPAMIVFNLACYASVTGRMEEAKEGLRHAIDLDKDIRALALDDEDLKPPWDRIGGLNSRQGFSSAGLFPLLKEVLNLVEVFETVKFPEPSGVS
jgi:hypothetical protein